MKEQVRCLHWAITLTTTHHVVKEDMHYVQLCWSKEIG